MRFAAGVKRSRPFMWFNAADACARCSCSRSLRIARNSSGEEDETLVVSRETLRQQARIIGLKVALDLVQVQAMQRFSICQQSEFRAQLEFGARLRLRLCGLSPEDGMANPK